MEDELAHYGTKGMKWGVRKEPELKGDTALRRAYIKASAPGRITEAEKLAALSANKKKFSAKFGDEPDAEASPQDGRSFWKPTPKQIAIGVVGAVAVGAVVYAGYKGYKYTHPPAGSLLEADHFKACVTSSQLNSWGGQGYIKPSSYNQKEFTLSAGHVFHRLSRNTEDGFKGATYATHSVEDFNRYVAGFRGELGHATNVTGLQHITFRATQDIKVPDLVTRLETMREVISKPDKPATRAAALDMYQTLSGGSWSGETANSFFDALRSKGFGAIIDDMDAGVIGESPLVVFAQNAFTSKEHEPMTQALIDAAESALYEITNRK